MSGLVTSYSSDEEDKKADVNYDNIGMEMSSSEEEDAKTADERAMFGSKEDYDAYKKQFDKKVEEKTSEDNEYGSTANEYGGTEEEDEYGGAMPKAKPKQVEKDQDDNDGFKTRQEILEEAKKAPVKAETVSAKVQEQSRHRPRRSRSRSRERRSRSRDRRRSRSPRHRRRRSRSRSRSRSRDRYKRKERQRHHRDRHQRRHHDNYRSRELERQEQRNRKLVNLGLATKEDMDIIEAGASAAKQSDSGDVRGRQMQAQMAKVKEMTGVELPSYYNPTSINPLKFAEQIKKRKLLWGKKPEEQESEQQTAPKPPSLTSNLASAAQPRGLALLGKSKPDSKESSFNNWEATNFGNNQTNEKFRRLMGIKGSSQGVPAASSTTTTSSKQMFDNQEMQYEKARAITHTQRGLGLGFSNDALPGAVTPSETPSSNIQFVRKTQWNAKK